MIQHDDAADDNEAPTIWRLYQLVIKISDTVSRLEERYVAVADASERIAQIAGRVTSLEAALATLIKRQTTDEDFKRSMTIAAASALFLVVGSVILILAGHLQVH